MTRLLDLGSSRPASVPAFLGGCFVRRDLGRRAIGAVYLARQLAFNRHVALETMRPQWAQSPTFVSLVHPRGLRRGTALAPSHRADPRLRRRQGHVIYFITEFVDGKTLGSLVRDRERLDFVEAVAYVLQAARGLKCRA